MNRPAAGGVGAPMSVYLPTELIGLFRVALGMEWENIDTDAMRVDAHAWRAAVGKVRSSLAPEMTLAVQRVRQGIEGQASSMWHCCIERSPVILTGDLPACGPLRPLRGGRRSVRQVRRALQTPSRGSADRRSYGQDHAGSLNATVPDGFVAATARHRQVIGGVAHGMRKV